MRIHHATVAKAKKFQITLAVESNEIVATSKTGTRLASGLQGNKVLEDAITKLTGKAAKGSVKATAVFGAEAVSNAINPKPAKKAKKAKKPVAKADPYEDAAKENGWKKTRWGFRNEDGETISEIDSRRVNAWQELCIEQGYDAEVDEEADEDSDADQGKSIVKSKYKQLYKPHKDKSGDDLSFRINDHVSREDDAGELKIDLDALRTFAKANDCWVPSYASFRSRTGGWNAGMARMNVANRLRARLRRIAKEQDRKIDIDKDIVWE